jgi:hypothetical protein
LFLPPTAICLIFALILHVKAKKWVACVLQAIALRRHSAQTIPVTHTILLNFIFERR